MTYFLICEFSVPYSYSLSVHFTRRKQNAYLLKYTAGKYILNDILNEVSQLVVLLKAVKYNLFLKYR